jgi:hypothetical protein
MVEGRVIKDPREDPKRRWANSVLAETILYHVIEYNELVRTTTPLPEALKNEEVLRENGIFCKMTELERRGAELSEFVPLLNNGPAPLALLAKIVDYAVTHSADDLNSLVGTWDSHVLRVYRSMDDLDSALKMDALAGERIYAPVAELFGYPSLAGSIFKHSYRVNHPEIYNHVMETLSEPSVAVRLSLSQKIIKEVARQLKEFLKIYDFDAVVAVRPRKDEGKLMRKIYRSLSKSVGESGDAASRNGDNGKSLAGLVSSFDFDTISDWAALRVILYKFKGKDIDTLPEAEKGRAIAAAVKLVQGRLEMLKILSDYSFEHSFHDKDNGYRAHHWDVRSNGLTEARSLPFEIQLKTAEWHAVAERGKAAHYYYIGGESEFVDAVAKAYKGIIHMNDPSDTGRRQSRAPPPYPRSEAPGVTNI